MRQRKRSYSMIAWILVFSVVLSLRTTAWAKEPEMTETQTGTEALIQTDKEAEEITEKQSEETEMTETGTPPEPMTAATEQTEKITYAETEELEEPVQAEPEPNRRPRAGAQDEKFQKDKLIIKIDDNKVYEEVNGVPVGSNVTQISSKDVRVSFEMAWSQVDKEYNLFEAGDTVTFFLCEIQGPASAKWFSVSAMQHLYDEETNKLLGYGTFVAEKIEPDILRMSYKVEFTDDIEGMKNIRGTMTGGASIRGVVEGDKLSVRSEKEEFAEITILPPDPPKSGTGIITPNPVPLTNKTVGGKYNSNNHSVMWRIQMTDYKQYQFPENGIPSPSKTYEHLIMEEILDMHQTFYQFTPTVSTTPNIAFYIPTYLYDSNNLDLSGSAYQAHIGWVRITEPSLLTMIDSSVDPVAAEARVRNEPRTWTIIKEDDPDFLGKQRERLIVNLGAPGNGGVRYSELKLGSGGILKDKVLESLNASWAYADNVVTTYDGQPESTLIADADGKKTTLAEWRNIKQRYEDSIAYYSEDPYIYVWRADVTSYVKTFQPETSGTIKVKNKVIITGGFDEIDRDAELDNDWSATISAKADPGEVQILKADDLYGYPEGDLDELKDLGAGAIEGVEFQVYRTDDATKTPLKFKIDSGKYVLDNTATNTIVKTNTKGSFILSGLTDNRTYTLKEIKSGEGFYTEEKEITFTVNSSKVVYHLINNTTRGVKVNKVDASDNSIKLTGAVFELYKVDGVNSDQLIGFTKKTIGTEDYYVYDKVGTGQPTVGADGILRIIRLPAGSYYLKEITPPSGYILPPDAENKFEFELEDPPQNPPIVEITVENSKDVKAQLEAKKKLDGAEYDGTEYSFVLTKDGESNPLETIDTVDNGSIKFSELSFTEEGTYTYWIEEIPGTDLTIAYDSTRYKAVIVVDKDNEGKLRATVTYSKEGTNLPSGELPLFENNTSSLEVVKEWKDAQGNILDPETSLIEGVEVQLVIVKSDGTKQEVPGQSMILKKADDWKGAFTDFDLRDSQGDPLNFSVIEKDIIYKSGTTADQKLSIAASVAVTNTVPGKFKVTLTNTVKGKIIVNKVDENGDPLKDVTFRLQAAKVNGTEWEPESPGYLEEKTTPQNGKITFENVPAGKYLLTEIRTASDKQLLAQPVKIEIPFVMNGGQPGETASGGIKGTDGKTYYYHLTYTIQNNELLEMPSSGSGGSWIYYLVGICTLTATFGAAYLRRKRRLRVIRRV